MNLDLDNKMKVNKVTEIENGEMEPEIKAFRFEDLLKERDRIIRLNLQKLATLGLDEALKTHLHSA